ncbi:MAG TPA: NAD(P)H-dependent glycerol-3-phosphate dehydrogenase [Pyrinomonadaceae bacterium]|nr:NAD(P)H-dependent glycerol-3-phosphate dehydrogenase [Pyrinomonadaceae bacterium]
MPLKQRIAIIGAGSWGTALAIVAARAGHEVQLWSRTTEVATSINEKRVNDRYLRLATIPVGVSATTNMHDAVREASIVIIAAPSHAVRQLLVTGSSSLDPTSIIVSAAKGIEIDSAKRISEIVTDVIGAGALRRFVCLSGPSFAEEVVASHPTAVVAASIDEQAAQTVQVALSFETLRIYTNTDVVGTELGGAVKNVMAIAAGMVSGLGFGSNTLAALITRGLAEISRLALFQGAQVETLMGLAGLGDLVLTCTGKLSRNRSVGEQLGKGKPLDEIIAGMNEVAEGIKTTLAVKQLADSAGLEMPITNEVKAVLYDGKSAQSAVSDLMNRPLKQEK